MHPDAHTMGIGQSHVSSSLQSHASKASRSKRFRAPSMHPSNKDAQQRNKDPCILPCDISRRSENTTTVHGDLPLHACCSL